MSGAARQALEMLAAPRLLCLSDDNYALRVHYARVTGDRLPGAALPGNRSASAEEPLIACIRRRAEGQKPTARPPCPSP
jgi:hypothetical protein